jgi:hypothetical protein
MIFPLRFCSSNDFFITLVQIVDPRYTGARTGRHAHTRPLHRLSVQLIETYKTINATYYERKARRQLQQQQQQQQQQQGGREKVRRQCWW